MKYEVSVLSVYSEVLTVEADSKEEALLKFQNGEGELVDDALDYSHQLTDLDTVPVSLVRQCL